MNLLTVNNLASGYGRIPVLEGVQFHVAEAEFLGVLGHNGMGKSTLLKTLMGVLPATAGAVRLQDADITRLPSHRRARMGMGYVPQGRGIFPGLSVLDNLRFSAKANPGRSMDVQEILDEYPRLKPLAGRPGGALSGGEQQLLALARALVARPRLLLLDEPTEGIQPSIIDEIVDKLKDIRERLGLAIVLVEQNIDFIRQLSDRVLLIHKGAINRALQPGELTDESVLDHFT
ncbi:MULTISPECIES: ABC transporter ATP-binding protein [Achromobacter]|uniref:ABC transporter ATP-binding protein n=1 Tax=Achromobacter denitrificans TaxID=32002 RepID=A0A6N0JPG3_ACHDE|nr:MULTISPECIES: ABC transporter ATP-binding protein [Achromobacter]MDF3848063.1 ABC transporter ATP-binding protein [Achromobacter denitrificans]MDF3860033.1 ABC transporter ATP-binding protein [Achromobacter denitrificans]MDF3941320.1 ABC transporter ATP-binding protein [Achromobacter denitrificans]MDX3881364.1 ABC transporter ATP-binding protein [Achromobacter sp.]QKQ48944.1 ABC transporter ATP-binding protein [Achromobacter denitrificans]